MQAGTKVKCVKFGEAFTGTVIDEKVYRDDPYHGEYHVKRDDNGETIFLVTTGGRSTIAEAA